MLQVEEAQAQILSHVRPLDTQLVPLSSAINRVLGEPIVAPLDLPPFDNSAMDGYALQAADVAQAAPNCPVPLRLIGQAAAGQVFSGTVSPGQCVRLFTGSPLPAGADAVIMQEETQVDQARPGQVLMLGTVQPWENVRFQGEDVKQGSVLLDHGERLTVGQIGLLAALGCAQVQVRRAPVLGLIATGSELCEPPQKLGPSQIYESNRVTLAALASAAGAQPRMYPLVKDDLALTQAALATALAECDVVVTSGGVSVGEMDLVKAAFHQLGGELVFWRVAMKPGKPFVLGNCRGKVLFGLPGNPVSAFVTFLVLVRPALLRLQGARETQLPRRLGVLSETLSNRGDRRHFVRVFVDHAGQVRSTGTQASHLLCSLAAANGLVDVPPQAALPAGTTVSVLGWD